MYRGVVQLFNAVHKQQSLVEGKLAEAGSSVRQREKAMQSLTKGRFLDMLKNVKVCICRIYLHILLLKWLWSWSEVDVQCLLHTHTLKTCRKMLVVFRDIFNDSMLVARDT